MQRLTLQKTLQVLGEEHHRVVDPGLGMVGAVGREQQVVQPVHRVAVGQRLVQEFGAGAVIMGCAGMARYRRRLEDEIKVPVIDPTQAGVAMAMGRLLALQVG